MEEAVEETQECFRGRRQVQDAARAVQGAEGGHGRHEAGGVGLRVMMILDNYS